jgi:alpha-glucosidase (family GH31 glycosyl hydrolase)
MIRSLGLAFPDDARAWKTVDAYLFGPSLLAAPVYERGATSREVSPPAGTWWNYWTGLRIEGGREVTVAAPLESMPLMVRAGAIVPSGPVKQWADQPSNEPTLITVYPGADGSFTLYEDDGQSFAYEQGDFGVVLLRWNDGTHTLTVHRGKGHRVAPTQLRVKLVGGAERSVTLSAAGLSLKLA